MRGAVLPAAGLCVAVLVGCAGGDVTRRENILRQRQYELDQRDTRLRAAERRFKECVAQRYQGEDPGLDPPRPAATGGGGSGGAAAGGVLTAEELEEIQRVERIGRTAIIACYTDELERRGNKDLQGAVVVRILVGTGGRATEVQIGKSTLNAPRIHACMIKSIREWELPALKEPAWYSTTFELSPAY